MGGATTGIRPGATIARCVTLLGGSVSPTAISDLVDFLNETNVSEMLRRFGREELLFDTFKQFKLPPGIDADEMWRILKAIRFGYSLEIPVPSPTGTTLCYFVHHDILARLGQIDYHCHPDSRFSLELADRRGSPFVVRTQIQEAIATSQLDGLEILPRDATEVILLDRKPRNGGERIVKNTSAAMATIEDYAGDRFTPDLLHEFYRRVTDGVEAGSCSRGKGLDWTGLRRRPYGDLARTCSDKPVSLICAYCNEEIGDPREHPAIRALNIRGIINHWLPMPDWNGNVASLVFRLYCLKHQYPAMGYLPFSHANQAWARGKIQPPSVLCRELPEPYVDERGREDNTPSVTIAVHLLDYELQTLLAYIRLTRERDAAVLASFQDDRSLNHRQRLIIARALREPTAEFRIRHHRTNHRVAYATARADLLELVDKGYLVCERRNRAFIFVPSPSLQERSR